MKKYLILILLLSLTLFAREILYPVKRCPAFNNMKHSKNTHAVHLDTKQKYTILKHHKGQNLILIKGEDPAQRWVDEKCFSKSSNGSDPMNVQKAETQVISIEDELHKISKKYENKEKLVDSRSGSGMMSVVTAKQNLLILSWHNAFCETYRYKKECKRSMFSFGKDKYSEKHFVLHGLWPQPRNKLYCAVSKKYVAMDKHKQWNRLPALGLSDDVEKRLTKVMPGIKSNLHKHEWIKHGTDANSYYKDAVNLVEQVNDSKVGAFFTKNIGKDITLQQVRAVFNRNFGVSTGKRVELKCKKGLVTELWLHLGSGSDDIGTLLKRGKQTRSLCQKGLIDKAGYGR